MKNIDQFANPVRMVAAKHGDLVYNQYDQWIGRSLEHYGQYCDQEIELFRYFIQASDTIWEIGANTGSQSVALAKMVPDGLYFGFEPQIELFKLFTTNLTLNNCENATPLNLALGAEKAIITLPKLDYHASNNFGGMSMIGRQNLDEDGFKVPQERADDLTHIAAPNFIKIDVEGMEIDVLHGAKQTILSARPLMYLENDRLEKSAALISALWDLNYDCYWHLAPYFEEDNYFNNPHNVFGGHFVSCNMLCLPREKSIKINGLVPVDDLHFHPLKA